MPTERKTESIDRELLLRLHCHCIVEPAGFKSAGKAAQYYETKLETLRKENKKLKRQKTSLLETLNIVQEELDELKAKYGLD